MDKKRKGDFTQKGFRMKIVCLDYCSKMTPNACFWSNHAIAMQANSQEQHHHPSLRFYSSGKTQTALCLKSEELAWVRPSSTLEEYLGRSQHRQEGPEITCMAMGFRPHSFPVGGMYVKGIGRSTKVIKNHSLLFSITS